MLFAILVPVFAEEGFYADGDLAVNDQIDTSSFVVGNNVDMKADVDGMNFVAGNNITLSSSQDHLFAAGNILKLENVTTKDAFLAGNEITIDSSVVRNLFVAAQKITINSNISRNVYAGGGSVIINGTILGDCKISANNVVLGENAVIQGTLSYPEKATVTIPESATVENVKTYETKEFEMSFKTSAVTVIVSFLALLLAGFAFMSVCKGLFAKIEKEDTSVSYLLKTSLIGLACLILVPLAAIIFMITIIGIPLSLIALVIYGIILYLSSVLTAFYLGKWLLKEHIKNDFLLLTVSLLGITILKYIPIIGGFVSLISLVFGLGVFMKALKKNNLEKTEK